MLSRRELANAIRALSMDAVEQAKSGHPGAPMGMADIAEVLWNDFLQHNPENPTWWNRDRFVLSNGHGSMLIYALLHLSGYSISIDEIKAFRQLHSQTPGHPEYGDTPGVETTTGPLGQGIANAVGMALAEKNLAAQFNRDHYPIVDHYTYVFLGDGCLMEGVSHEACSLAGTLGLGKLIAFYDDNGISIDGDVSGWFTDNTPERFKAYHWHVIADIDGHDPVAIKSAIEAAREVKDQPSLICCKTVIGFGSPNKQGKESCHGAPLGADEIALARKALAWQYEPFVIPDEIYQAWNACHDGRQREAAWSHIWQDYKAAYPELAEEYQRRMQGDLPKIWQEKAAAYIQQTVIDGATIASRKASQNCLNAYAPILPELIGGSADLAGSNLTWWSQCQAISADDARGNYIHYGVREFGMAAIMNGISLHGGFIPYGATFLVFSDYARNALRMAALMGQRAIFVFTHDSIGLGADGPTHQPIEQMASLRAIPNTVNWRPCDSVESAVAWKQAIERTSGPSNLIFSRQDLPHQTRSAEAIANIARGGYILDDCDGTPQIILIATGSEVALAREVYSEFKEKGVLIRLVSMPSTEVFDQQDIAYRDTVLPPGVTKRVSIEAGITAFWYKYIGHHGKAVGIDRFGASAPADVLFKYFNLTKTAVCETVDALIQ